MRPSCFRQRRQAAARWVDLRAGEADVGVANASCDESDRVLGDGGNLRGGT